MAKSWGKSGIAELERLAAAGVSRNGAAQHLKATPGEVAYMARKLDIKFHGTRGAKPGVAPCRDEGATRKRWETLLPILKDNLREDLQRLGLTNPVN